MSNVAKSLTPKASQWYTKLIMEPTATPKKIFIVDDDKFLLDMYTFKFKEKGFDVIQAFGSVDALNKLKGGIVPDIMLLDVVMPTMDGFELLSIIKNEKLAPNAKVLVLSNLGQPTDVEKGRSLGANGYVIKASATPSEVVEKVMTVMGGGESFAKVD
ncbi:MAG: Response regulator receiver protein [Parcubacteria group bacterium GW2011_GWA1_44_13]|uniref:Response regulator receiver protein n=1 Tax=Candidatus Nomurabacteria bacterium GW2011_GWB1_44_12 TaxID=1618748 RepID=A0A837II06_9BACT|nr:MAG: Response regulator receiver protein [Candidatus Nomurabacteria bacterium GW2011_GWB1_44_12]KKT37411.1 MAG: Response regulator receiver protein [Parcubacteria group bacterium GW2011_GWA1_44_13]KKT60889.1 MAG: Response regulator receiver protein [Parcubacteria group bacterium GW2011_GWC1_44_26]HBB44029.1 response regulator [Candidatus Yonathbacteria bacterium]